MLHFIFTDIESRLDENRQLRDQRLCKDCLDLDTSIAFLPCGHIVCCSHLFHTSISYATHFSNL